MTSKEFVLWLKGFTEGVHEFNITPKQWDILKDKLDEVKDEEPIGFPFGVPNTAPIQTLPFIQPYNPHNPYTINCGSGSSGTITTTPLNFVKLDTDGKTPIFSFPYLDGRNKVPFTDSFRDNVGFGSRFQIQLGVRYLFN